MAKLRNGEEIQEPVKGHLGRVLVGEVNGRTTCWRLDGRYRWDDADHPLDIMQLNQEEK